MPASRSRRSGSSSRAVNTSSVRWRSRYSSMSRFTNARGERSRAASQSGRSRSTTRATVPGAAHGEIWDTSEVAVAALLQGEVPERPGRALAGRLVERAQPGADPGDRARRVPRRGLGHERGDLDGDVVDVLPPEQVERALGPAGGLPLPQHRL